MKDIFEHINQTRCFIMLKFNLTHIFEARGIKQPYSFLKDIGLSHTVAHRLVRGDTRTMNLDHMGKICEALCCTPNDLVALDAEAANIPEDHPMHQLTRDEEAVNLLEELKSVPLDKLDEIQEQIRNMKQSSDAKS